MSATIVAVQLVIVLVLAVLYGLAHGKWLSQVAFYFPPASTMMILGLILGAIFELSDEISEVFAFNPHIFFSVLLPPIIFHAGLKLPKASFFRNLGSILTFSFLGTLIAAVLIGSLIYAVRDSTGMENVSYVNCMVLGSLLSAVDPVSTIAVFQKSGVDVSLYTLVFGESVLNDAVAIVINRVFSDLAESDDNNTGGAVAAGFGKVIGIAIGSLLMGSAFALTSAFIHRHTQLHKYPPLELAMVVSFSYLSFIVAEESELSGIMSTLFCAIIMDHYTLFNISRATYEAADALYTMLADVAESFVFVYLGMAPFTFNGHDFKLGATLATLFWCILSRFITVFPVAVALNAGRKRKISLRHQFVMFLSGLRGAVAFALAFGAPRHRSIFVTITLVVVFVTTIVFGGATYPTLKQLKLTKEFDKEELSMTKEEISNHWFVKFDRNYLRPYFRTRTKHRAPRERTVDNQQAATAFSGREDRSSVDMDKEVRLDVSLDAGVAPDELSELPSADDSHYEDLQDHRHSSHVA